MLTVEEFTYLAATDFLYYVLVVFEDEINSQYYNIKYGTDYAVFEKQSEWSPLVDTVLKWALDEWLEHQSRPSNGIYESTKSTLSDATGHFFMHTQQYLTSAANRPIAHLDWLADDRMPIALYLYYCSWLFYVLRTFQEIRIELTATSPQLSVRFDPIRDDYKQLQEILQEELQSIAMIVGVDKATAEHVRADVEAVGEDLARDWRQAVYDTARELQAEQ